MTAEAAAHSADEGGADDDGGPSLPERERKPKRARR
jgi:hypothetical protein